MSCWKRIFLGLACIFVVHLNPVVGCRTERHRYRLRYVLAARIAVVRFSSLSGILTVHEIAYLYVKLVLKDAEHVRLYEQLCRPIRITIIMILLLSPFGKHVNCLLLTSRCLTEGL